MFRQVLIKFIIALLSLFPTASLFAKDKEDIEKSLTKEKMDFGDAIKESANEAKTAETNYKKIVKTKKYTARKTKGKQKVRLDIPNETIEVQDNIQWDHNKKDVMKQKNKLDHLETLEAAPKK
jgi:hypothetical protein